ncbi:uncharacterized protein Eint_010460 [Encephalitozoon intestinalis ATCC 50506]|uniref:Uncharacterized protein n=1 Tax=Encephalitozoon intestinalis (strain ATCC 50506) TaxID=876142 RepID=E0S5C4_ENCIT|nr:uncharacterized protein Eint_010460 [Encephalitozoon intestinalis ATCC 50506]ADM10909.1 hypothetical protein Eint_010460 [Encephalitozoon intestinalis ATCC 50506]UTX44543.1 hypothetical protein GPK93_01g00520 [Encephalitozoon intestinalis]
MIIKIVSTVNVPDAEVISDLQRTYVICPEKKYVLKFTSGDVTLKAFKELFLLGKEILFYVVNFEFFFYKMRMFKHYRFEFVMCSDEEKSERIENYKDIERRLAGEYSNRGVELSFMPDVFASIRSSLLSPELYLSKENPSTIIYKLLTKKFNYEELKRLAADAIGRGTDTEEALNEDFDRHLKSLVFVGAVKMKDGLFYRWDY